MTQKTKKNKLNIFLVKEEYNDCELSEVGNKLLSKDVESLGSKRGEDYVLFYKENPNRKLSWAKFFDFEELNNMKLSNVSGICFKKIKEDLFAIAFGHGKHLMKDYIYEHNFGLKIVLNLIDKEKIKKTSTKNLAGIPKDTTIQSSRYGDLSFFTVDEYSDLLKNITGKINRENDNEFLNHTMTLSGSSSFSINIDKTINDINNFLIYCRNLFDKNSYKEKGFGFIDNLIPVSKDIETKLNELLIEKIKKNDVNDVWAAVPDDMDWENLNSFYCTGNRNNTQEDIDLNLFLETIDDSSEISLDKLKNKEFSALNTNDENINSWSVLKCINAEIDFQKKSYILTDGLWLQVEKDFLTKVNLDYENNNRNTYKGNIIEYSKISDNNNDCFSENNYNRRLAVIVEGEIFDLEMIQAGQDGRERVELCDVLKDDGFIHVKRYSSSSVLSHLFSQGFVSAKNVRENEKFRDKVNGKISDKSLKLKEDGKYSVIFVILHSSGKDFKLPFFSKLTFNECKKNVEKLKKFEVFLVHRKIKD